MENINFATATQAELAAAGFTFKKMASTVRDRKSLFGVKQTANKKGCNKSALGSMTETGRDVIR